MNEIHLRAAISGGRVTLAAPGCAEIHRESLLASAAERSNEKVAVASIVLRRLDEGGQEIEVDFLTGDRPESRAAIVEWSKLVGHRRVWFADALVEHGGMALETAMVSSVCPACDVSWTDDGKAFWAETQRRGFSPLYCALCGASVPQRSPAAKGKI